MWLGPDSRGQQPLISEAVRGEGAFLVDCEGNRFMQGVHELADLAPRDVVAKAITRRMHETGQPAHVARRPPPRAREFWERRFPTILATCRSHGVDPVTELIPVAPACHYASGGVATDLWGQSDAARASTPPARSPAPACTAPTGSPPTRCSRGWSSRAGSPSVLPGELRAVRRARPPTRAPPGLVAAAVLRRDLQERDDRPGRRAPHGRRAGRGASTTLDALADEAERRPVDQDVVGDHQPGHDQHARWPSRAAARGDPRLALARGLPRARRRALARALRRGAGRRRAAPVVPPRRPCGRAPDGHRTHAVRRPARRRSSTSWPRPGSTGAARRTTRSCWPSRRTCPAARPTSPATPPSPPTPAASPTSRPASPASSPGSASPRWSSTT